MRLALLAFATAIPLVGCTSEPDSMPETADYTLMWYPREGTDFSRIVPGFETLSMCRYAGSNQTMQYLIDKHGFREDYSDLESAPWFECGTGCRIDDDFKVMVCKKIEETHGDSARFVAKYGAQ